MRKLLTVVVAVVASAGIYTATTATAAPTAGLCRLENVGTQDQPWLVLVSDDPTSDGLCWSV